MRGEKKNWRDAFHLRTGGHSWITIMHQHLTRTISDNSCKTHVGLLLIYWRFMPLKSMAGTIITRYVFIHPCSWNILEHCGNGQKIHAWEKCRACKFGTFIVVRCVLGKRVNFKHVLVRFQDGKTCGNFCLVLVDNVLWYNPMRIFLRLLESLFAGPIQPLEEPDVLTEPLWGLAELGRAVHRLKLRKCGDDVGLTAEVLKHAPTKFWEHLLPVYNDIPYHGAVPRSWFCTLFNMLPKKGLANIRLFYKVLACLLVDRIEHQLDDHQPEEQHGFRRGKRIEEHLLTANVFLDKALDVGIPVWVGKFRFVQGIWPCPSASTLERFAWTRHLRTHDLDDFEFIRCAIWRGHRIDRSKQKIQHYRRRAARMCFEPSSLLCRVTICHAEMENESWRPWFWFVGWHAASHWSTICRRHPAFRTFSHGSKETVGQLGGWVVGGRSSVERRQTCYFDKSKPTALNNHDWPWSNTEGSARQCRAEMVGVHVSCIRIGTKFLGPGIPSPRSNKSVSCQQMDFGRPGRFPFPRSSVFWCCCFIGILILLFQHPCKVQDVQGGDSGSG